MGETLVYSHNGIRLSDKKESTVGSRNKLDLKAIMVSENTQPQRLQNGWFYLYDILEIWKQIRGFHGTGKGYKGSIYKRVAGRSSFTVMEEFCAFIFVLVTQTYTWDEIAQKYMHMYTNEYM